jgi:rSAM/selenodomain-associated transferase 1
LRVEKAIILFVKDPQPGRVKTRLAAAVGEAEAAAIYKQLVEAVCRVIPQDCNVEIFYDPPEKRVFIESWLRTRLPARVRFFAQTAGDLGVRMAQAFAEVFTEGARKVAIIGSDCVELCAATFGEAWRALDTHDCVIGPSHDGGYYLLGLTAPRPRLFEGVAWSSATTLRDTLARARELGVSVHLLPELHDVDTEIDWRRAQQNLTSRDATH